MNWKDRMIALNEAESQISPPFHSGENLWRWPLVKFFAYCREKDRKNLSLIPTQSTFAKKTDELEKALRTTENRLVADTKPNSLLMIRMSSKCVSWEENEKFHRLFDPLTFGNRHPSQIKELDWIDTPQEVKIHDNPKACIGSFLNMKLRRIPSEPLQKEDINSLNNFNESLESLGIEKLDFNALRAFMDKVKCMSLRASKLFKRMQPKAVLSTCCFADPVGFAISLGGYISKIPIIDFQHGQQGPNHPFYCHWPHATEISYPTMPSHFWTWGKLTAENIGKWNKKNGAIIVGAIPGFK